jgi:hypothetical protein
LNCSQLTCAALMDIRAGNSQFRHTVNLDLLHTATVKIDCQQQRIKRWTFTK